jgi:hypothetical protein
MGAISAPCNGHCNGPGSRSVYRRCRRSPVCAGYCHWRASSPGQPTTRHSATPNTAGDAPSYIAPPQANVYPACTKPLSCPYTGTCPFRHAHPHPTTYHPTNCTPATYYPTHRTPATSCADCHSRADNDTSLGALPSTIWLDTLCGATWRDTRIHSLAVRH